MTVIRVEPVSCALFLCAHKSSDDNKMAVFLQKTQAFSRHLNVKTHQADFEPRVLPAPSGRAEPLCPGMLSGVHSGL